MNKLVKRKLDTEKIYESNSSIYPAGRKWKKSRMKKIIGALYFVILRNYLNYVYFSQSCWHHAKKCFIFQSILLYNVSLYSFALRLVNYLIVCTEI